MASSLASRTHAANASSYTWFHLWRIGQTCSRHQNGPITCPHFISRTTGPSTQPSTATLNLEHITKSPTASHSMMPRTIGAIGIAHTGTGTGTCKFYALHNGAVISANHFRALPMPSEVIAHLTRLAEADKLKIQKDPVFQISALANPDFTGTDSDQANVLPIPAEEAAQDLTLLDTHQPERPPSPPPTTHRADDLLSPTRADIDRRRVPLVHSEYHIHLPNHINIQPHSTE